MGESWRTVGRSKKRRVQDQRHLVIIKRRKKLTRHILFFLPFCQDFRYDDDDDEKVGENNHYRVMQTTNDEHRSTASKGEERERETGQV